MAPVQVNKRLLFGSLAVSAVVSVAVGWAIAQNDDNSTSGGTDDVRPAATFETPSIETNAVVKGEQLPDVKVQNLAGEDVAITSLVGTPMVINVWGSTCGPCKQELPAFAAAHATYGDRVQFVGVDYLPPSKREEAFARDRGVQYELLYDGNGVFISTVGIAAFPVTLFVNADGVIIRQTGQLDEAQLADYIESELL